MSGVLQFQSGPTVPTDIVIVTTGNGYGSTNNKIRIFSVTQQSTGSSITYATSATAGDSFTINVAGTYAIEYSDIRSGGVAAIGISVNSNQLTTSIASITATHRLNIVNTPGAASGGFVSATVPLSVGDVVRAHTDGTADQNDALVRFKVSRVT